MLARCTECGEIRPLNPDRVCVYRDGCDRRVATHDNEMRRLYQQMDALDPLPCGHTGIDHARMRTDAADWLRDIREGYQD